MASFIEMPADIYYNLLSTGPHEITKITLDIWGDDYCGSNHGPYIEILSKNGEKRNTYFHGPFSSGTTLIWDNNGENRYGGKNLGGVSGFQVDPLYFPFNPSTHYGIKILIQIQDRLPVSIRHKMFLF